MAAAKDVVPRFRPVPSIADTEGVKALQCLQAKGAYPNGLIGLDLLRDLHSDFVRHLNLNHSFTIEPVKNDPRKLLSIRTGLINNLAARTGLNTDYATFIVENLSEECGLLPYQLGQRYIGYISARPAVNEQQRPDIQQVLSEIFGNGSVGPTSD